MRAAARAGADPPKISSPPTPASATRTSAAARAAASASTGSSRLAPGPPCAASRCSSTAGHSGSPSTATCPMPSCAARRPAAFPDRDLRGRELADGRVKRGRRRDEAEGEEGIERRRVPCVRETGQGDERRQRRACGQSIAVGGEVERHEPQLIARQEEPPPPRVPEGEGKGPPQGLHGLEPALLVQMRDDLGVVPPAQRMPPPERHRELAAVVEPAGEDGPHRAVLVDADREARVGAPRQMRQQQGPPGEVRTSPPPCWRLVVRPPGKHEHRVHAQPELTSSTSSCTTAIVYSPSATRSVARSWKASW